MKILWLSHLVPYPPKAGVLIRSHYLVKELAKYHDVDLIAFNQRGLIEPYFESYAEGTRKAEEVMQNICGRVKFIDCPMDSSPYSKGLCAFKSLFSSLPYTINWLGSDDYKQVVAQWCKETEYDLVHFDTISLAPYLSAVSDNSLNSPLLSLDHHNVESHMLIRRADLESNPLKKAYFSQEGKRLEVYEKQVCPQFDINLTCSELDSQRFEQISPQSNFVEIPNGVDTEFFKPADTKDRGQTLIFIGTLDWYPNTRAVRYIANEIWPKLKPLRPDLTIKIIGAGAPDDLLELDRQDKQFNMLGFVDDLKPYMDDAAIYVCPIDDGGGTKLKLLDAFASGKAVIAHKVACEGLRVEDGEQVLLANDADSYVEKIIALLDDDDRREQLELKARQHVEAHFSYESIGQQLSEQFTQLKQ